MNAQAELPGMPEPVVADSIQPEPSPEREPYRQVIGGMVSEEVPWDGLRFAYHRGEAFVRVQTRSITHADPTLPEDWRLQQSSGRAVFHANSEDLERLAALALEAAAFLRQRAAREQEMEESGE